MDFESKLDNRGPFTYKEMFPLAEDWAETRNLGSGLVRWSWDAGLKLDYDGQLVYISSRFYPPHKSHVDYGKYHGHVSIFFGEKKMSEKKFESKTLAELANEVEKYVAGISAKIDKAISNIFTGS